MTQNGVILPGNLASNFSGQQVDLLKKNKFKTLGDATNYDQWDVKKYDYYYVEDKGEQVKFKFQNNTGVHSLQLHKKIACELKYGVSDWYRMTLGQQGTTWTPWWHQPTVHGDTKVPNRGIDRLPKGGVGLTDMELPQAFSDKYNHEFETTVHNIFKIVEKDSALDFMMPTVIDKLEATHWFERTVHFNKPVFEKGARKQDYPLVTYYESITGGTYVSTGHGIAIPFNMLFKNGNGAKGKYAIDKFIMHGFEAIAIGFKDFYSVYLFERCHNLKSEHIKYVQNTGKRYETFDELIEFEESITGMLNTEHRLNEPIEYPVEWLINEIKKHIKIWNPQYGSGGNKIGIIIDDFILHAERYKKYNNKYSWIGEKTGTFRNTDTQDEGDDIWVTKKLDAVIFGMGPFADTKRPKGFSPLQQTVRSGYWFEMPDYEEVINKEDIQNYRSNHHDVQAITTEKLPVNYQWIKIRDVIKLIDEDLFAGLFKSNDKIVDFGGILDKSFNANQSKIEDYLKTVYDIVVQTQWNKLVKNKLDLKTVIQDIKFSLEEGSHKLGVVTGNQHKLSSLPGLKDFILLIGKIVEFLKDMKILDNIPESGQALKAKLFLYLIFSEDDIKSIKDEEENDFVNIVLTQIEESQTVESDVGLSSIKGHGIINNEAFRGLFKNDAPLKFQDFFSDLLKKLPQDEVNNELLIKFINWNIPLFFRPVVLRFEDLCSYSAFFGTQGFAQKLDLQPTATASFDPRIFEAKIQFRDNIAIRIRDKQNIYIAHNVFIDFNKSKNRLNCNLPKENNEFFKIMLFNYSTDLKSIKRLFYRNVPTGLRSVLEQNAYDELIDTHNLPEISQHLTTGVIDNESMMIREEFEYFLKEKYTRHCAFAYKGGIKTYNPNTKKYDDYKELYGPMGKFYDHRK